MKKWGCLLWLGLLSVIICTGCSKGDSEAEEMGRYVEEVIEQVEDGRNYKGLVQEGDSVRMVHSEGKDFVSVDGGRTFAADNGEAVAVFEKYFIHQMAAAPDGSRMFGGFEVGTGLNHFILLTGDGTEVALMEPEKNSLQGHVLVSYYGAGYFYGDFISGVKNSVYRVEPSTGERNLVLEWEGGEESRYMAADERLLYIVRENSIQLYDLQEGQMARQDEVLSGLAAEGVAYATYGNTFILYPYQEGVYILNHGGLYWHEMYGEDTVKVIDGKQCGIGLPERDFTGMTVLEGKEKPTFLISYTDGTLARYEFDATLSAVPDALRIYSVYEDGNILQAVNSFSQKFPDIPVIYETGMDAGYGVTEDDVRKKLATEIAAGEGPDILVMDDLPVTSYIDKEALMDLSFIREGMTDETYFVTAADAFSSGEGQYVIPLTFSIPVLAGKREGIEGVETLTQLADLLEAERAEGAAGPVFTSWDAESTLRLLAQSSMGAWVTDGSLEREKIREFLTQAKRVYDAVMVEPASYVVPHNKDASYWKGAYPLERWFDCNGVAGMMEVSVINYPEQQYHAGYLSGAGEDFIMFSGVQEFRSDDSCVLMPGQQYGMGLASTLLAVNRATGHGEDCRTFLEYMFSEEFQSEAELNGTPLNRAAYEARKVTDMENRAFQYAINEMFHFGWPREEDFNNLDDMLGHMTGLQFCDYQVYETVVSLGKEALTGERSMEDVLEDIEKKVKLYLAE